MIGVALREGDGALAPWPQTRKRPEQKGLAGACLTDDDNAVAGLDLDLPLLELGAAGGRRDLQIIDVDPARFAISEVDATLDRMQYVGLYHGAAEIGDTQERGPPIGDGAEILDEPLQRVLHLVEGADRHHQAAEGKVAGEIDGRGDEDRRHDGDPAIAGCHPCQSDHAVDDAARRVKHGIEIDLDAALLIRLAAEECDGIDMLIDAHQREAQLGFASIALGIAGDKRATDPIADQGGRARIDDRGPHHVARNVETPPADIENEAR